jgi:hypothetical protein
MTNTSNGIKEPPVVSHDEWLSARTALLAKEKEFTRLRDELSRRLRSESAVCSFAYFCSCNGKCGASCCSCRHSCAGFGHDFTGGSSLAGQCCRNAVGIRWSAGSPRSA